MPLDESTFMLLHYPVPRDFVRVGVAPEALGPTAMQLVMGKECHLVKVSSEREVFYWLGKLGRA